MQHDKDDYEWSVPERRDPERQLAMIAGVIEAILLVAGLVYFYVLA
jgi:hypothetical protein